MTDFDVCYFFPSVKIDKEESHFYIVFFYKMMHSHVPIC